MKVGPTTILPLLVLLIPLAFLITLRTLTSDDLEGVTFDPAPLITTPTQREARGQQRVNVVLYRQGIQGRNLCVNPCGDGLQWRA